MAHHCLAYAPGIEEYLRRPYKHMDLRTDLKYKLFMQMHARLSKRRSAHTHRVSSTHCPVVSAEAGEEDRLGSGTAWLADLGLYLFHGCFSSL